MKFGHTQVFNFQGAFRGLRNPLESWGKSDSVFELNSIDYCESDFETAEKYVEAEGKYNFEENYKEWEESLSETADWLCNEGILKRDEEFIECAFIGPNDLNLAQRMIKAGSSDRKFLRQIMVSVDITAPLYWWKEFDTYKVGTVANSTSTMHKLASTPITINCFETDDIQDVIIEDNENPTFIVTSNYAANTFIQWLEELRLKYVETKDKRYWKQLVRWLPNGWLQTRTVTLNYQVLRNIYTQRRFHKLTEWHQFCDWIKSLPYGQELITYNIDN